jgi:hypothetical protein
MRKEKGNSLSRFLPDNDHRVIAVDEHDLRQHRGDLEGIAGANTEHEKSLESHWKQSEGKFV